MSTDYLFVAFVLFVSHVAMFGMGYAHARSIWRGKVLPDRRADLRLVTDRPDIAARLRRTTGPSLIARVRDDLGSIRERVTRLTGESEIPPLIRVELCGIEVALRSVCRSVGTPMPAVQLVPLPDFDEEITDVGPKPRTAE